MFLKICKKCQIPKKLSNFNKHSKNKDGLYGICRACVAKRRKELKSTNKSKIETVLNKILRVENGFLGLEGKIKCNGCKEIFTPRAESHTCPSCQKKWRDENKEKVLLSKKKYRDNNKDKSQAYRDSTKERRREYDRARYLNKDN